MKARVYVETSIVSYLTARPTTDLLASAWRKVTLDWWETQRNKFDLCTSEVTLKEAAKGDPGAGARRLAALSAVPLIPVTVPAGLLATALVQGKALPAKAVNDALHIAVAAVHGVDFLLTWNYRHLDNAERKPAIRMICNQHGHPGPEICTPSELMGGLEDAG